MTRLSTLVCALLMLPAVAAAAPQWTNERADNVHETMKSSDFTCSTGTPSTLLVAAAAVGLVMRRRR